MGAIHYTPAKRHRFHLLDALRGIAAVLVVFWHAPGWLNLFGTKSSFLAVDFFFCLSGFVIAFSYQGRLEDGLSVADFMAARTIRLYPLYLIGIVLGSIIFVYINVRSISFPGGAIRIGALFVLQLLLLPNLRVWSVFLFPLDMSAWSIFFELVANLGYGLLVRKRLGNTKHLAIAFFCSLLILVIWTAKGGNLDEGAFNYLQDLIGLPRVTVSFCAGVLAVQAYRELSEYKLVEAAGGIGGLAVAGALIFLLLTPFSVMRTQVFRLLTVSLFFPALVLGGSLCQLPARFLASCAFLGDISYPLYLFHVPCLMVLHWSEIRPLAIRFPATGVWGVILLTVGLSQAAVRFYDVPVRRFLSAKYNFHFARKQSITQISP